MEAAKDVDDEAPKEEAEIDIEHGQTVHDHTIQVHPAILLSRGVIEQNALSACADDRHE